MDLEQALSQFVVSRMRRKTGFLQLHHRGASSFAANSCSSQKWHHVVVLESPFVNVTSFCYVVYTPRPPLRK
jgi:hypothetical protein